MSTGFGILRFTGLGLEVRFRYVISRMNYQFGYLSLSAYSYLQLQTCFRSR